MPARFNQLARNNPAMTKAGPAIVRIQISRIAGDGDRGCLLLDGELVINIVQGQDLLDLPDDGHVLAVGDEDPEAAGSSAGGQNR
jgi:hypothetical protein